MNTLIADIDIATKKLTDLQKQISDLEISANDHEIAARADRAKRHDLKKEAESLRIVLAHNRTALAVETELQAAQKARAAAESHEAASAATRAQLDALLAKAQEQKAE